MNIGNDRDLLREFINESYEHLENIERGALALEGNPADAEMLDTIFRAFHTFKGGAGFLNLVPINQLAHDLESLLDMARQHKLQLTSGAIDLILKGGDTLRQFVIEMGAQLSGQKPSAPCTIPTAALRARVRSVIEQTPPPGEAQSLEDDRQPIKDQPVPDKTSVPGMQTPTSGTAAVRVDVQKLDSLMDLVGELVIAESQLKLDPLLKTGSSQMLARSLAQLSRITRELHRNTLSMRMGLIRPAFQKMTRLIRDLEVKLSKQIDLTIQGEDTELDRNLVEEIHDPLVHMIRNSADHGIEKSETRVARGKSARGTIALRAFYRSGHIRIEIEDDGAGLNKERILAKAIEKGLVKPGAEPSEKEIFNLICAPGFSTAEEVTDISGRGVGMDVVRYNIEKLRGTLEVQSVHGQGSTFTISLPLTLAIIDGLIVHVGAHQFIVPTLSVRESLRPTATMISSLHERGEMVNVRGRLIPLLRLYEYFDIRPNSTDPAQSIIIVVESGREHRCLMVDGLIGKQEIVIKSLGDTFKQTPALTGAAFLGDGRIGLILDVNVLVQLRGVIVEKAE